MEGVFTWLSGNVALVSALTSLSMVLVWLFYANLFYRDFRSRHHPRILIHQAPDTQADSMCFVVNMSEQLVNVVGVFAVDTAEGRMKEITDYRHYSSDVTGGREMRSLLKQGPLGSGEFLHLGTFDELRRLIGAPGDGSLTSSSFEGLEIRVALYHGSAKLPIGARRTFDLMRDGQKEELRPLTFRTIQMTSRRERRKVLGWLESGQ